MNEPVSFAHDMRLPFSQARRWGLLLAPQQSDPGQLQVYYTESSQLTACLEIQRVHQRPLKLQKLAPDEFNRQLQQIYTASAMEADELMQDLGESLDLDSLADLLPEPEELMDSDDDAPIIRLINALVSEAIRKKGSDIHIEPMEERLRVRIRIDGQLQVVLEPPRTIAPYLISRIKVMSQLDIAEKRLPQDGRISLRIAGRPVDIRVSTIPGAHGERIVLRLLDKQGGRLDLDDLGMSAADQITVDELIHAPHGMFLLTGPTGSGKTTTLYAALSRINANNRNIMTVEDPIEYYLDGIGQTQVNSKVDMSFARGLRAILRQDPDVVMVGEIRDKETAETVIQASLTGHLVLSTLHTNTAIGAITRLSDIGIEPYLISSSLLATAAQRLVRRLCEDCKQAVELTAQEEELFAHMPQLPMQIYHARGCSSCGMSGYAGRLGLFEIIPLNDELKRGISRHASETEMQAIAGHDIQSLYHNGLQQVAAGITTLDEVLRVTRA